MDDASYDYDKEWREIASKELGVLPVLGRLFNIASEIATSVRQEFGGELPLAYGKLRELFALVSRVRIALNPLADENPYNIAERTRLERLLAKASLSDGAKINVWRFPSADIGLAMGDEDWNAWPVNRDELIEVAGEYMRQHFGRSRTLECTLISALAYVEVYGFGCGLKTQRFGVTAASKSTNKLAWRHVAKRLGRQLLRAGVATALGVLASEPWGETAGILVAVAFYVLFCIRAEALEIHQAANLQRMDSLLSQMLALSKETTHGPMPPALLRSRLEETTAMGAVWPQELWSLVLLAEHRCPWDHFGRRDTT